MSLHPSLKSKSGALEAHRNVLTRPERIAKLTEGGRFEAGRSDPIHLPKVRSIKVVTAKKKKEAAEGDAAAAPGATPAAGAATAPTAKGAAAPAKGAAAAPAAKAAAAPAAKGGKK